MRVCKVISRREFEAEGEIDIGVFAKTGNLLSISSEVRQEEDELGKYLSDEDIERLRNFLPDLEQPRTYTRFTVLMDVNGGLTGVPKVGEEIEVLNDEDIRKAHTISGEFRMPYLPYLMKKDVELAKIVILKLFRLFPEERDILEMILAEIEYSVMREVDL
ncbi:hypothetical protein [Geoglobus acetivorans]|uniref:Uncharacterized protein n=1 Tax=Geoglobus acetivorans TaxID=565033 RepID=A0A0A7GI47_GEOAI|nr:hypothetical protein GACE_1597 [Geoglobus acetivorans]